MPSRTEQLLGVVALGIVDRLRALPAVDAANGEVGAGALVHLQAWPGSSVSDLARVVGLSQPAAVRLVDRLADRGLVRREQGPDRRTTALLVTPEGSAVADSVLAQRSHALTAVVARLDAADRVVLDRLLSLLTADLASDRAEAVRTCRLCDRTVCTAGPGCPLDHTVSPGDPRPARPVE